MARKQQMERKTTVAIASGIMMTVVAAAVAIGINISIASSQQPTSGPGTYTPAALPAAATQQPTAQRTDDHGSQDSVTPIPASQSDRHEEGDDD